MDQLDFSCRRQPLSRRSCCMPPPRSFNDTFKILYLFYNLFHTQTLHELFSFQVNFLPKILWLHFRFRNYSLKHMQAEPTKKTRYRTLSHLQYVFKNLKTILYQICIDICIECENLNR